MMANSPIPTVTQEDLLAFHVRRYGRAFHNALSIPEAPVFTNQHDKGTKDDEDLGYYPDGVKRTLTDQQIDMFRHSEIQSLLRAKRHQMEMKSPESDVASMSGDIEGDRQSRESDQSRSAMMKPSYSELGKDDERINGLGEDDDDEEEYSRFLAAERQEFESATLARNSKRRGEDADYVDRKTSTRRRVRELDAAESRDEVLDYGEAPYVMSEPSKADRGHMIYAETVESQSDTLKVSLQKRNSGSMNKPVEGRKIWWPTIVGK